jgi:Photosynthetic reaction centre cytochrome C subunit
MTLTRISCVLAVVTLGFLGYQQYLNPALSAAPTTSPTPSNKAPSLPINPKQQINDNYVKQISEKIVGREQEPSEKVFENIQIEWLKRTPAGLLLRIMNDGYSRALGVSCTHCHSEQDFASDDKRPKRAAREMAAMHRMINQQLKQMQNLESKPQERAINCSTCHRGAVNPLANE